METGNTWINVIGLTAVMAVAGVVGWKLSARQPTAAAPPAASAKAPAKIPAQGPPAARPASPFPAVPPLPPPPPPAMAPTSMNGQPTQDPAPGSPILSGQSPGSVTPEMARQFAEKAKEIEQIIKNKGSFPPPNELPAASGQK